jgi:acylphosphatase
MGEPDRPEHAEILNDVRARVLVSGRVQGVFFRHTCAREATAAGLTGSVRNRSDGEVEAVLQGPKAAVEAVIAWCREGPPGARVDDVRVSWEPPADGPPDFQVGWSD